MKNVGNSSRGRSQGVLKNFRATMYWAHCTVIFAIAQLSCTGHTKFGGAATPKWKERLPFAKSVKSNFQNQGLCWSCKSDVCSLLIIYFLHYVNFLLEFSCRPILHDFQILHNDAQIFQLVMTSWKFRSIENPAWSTFEGHSAYVVISTSISAILGMLSRRTVSQQ